jgi:hypothetical protein
MRTTVVIVALLSLVACSQSTDKGAGATAPVPTPTPTPATDKLRADFIPTQAQLDQFRAEGPEPTLRKIAATDYWLNYKLMQATGIEKELGGEAQAIAALQALGNAYERRMRSAETEIPRMIPTDFTGEGMESGFMGLGMGSFLGMITGGLSSGMVSQMSDAQIAELNEKGGLKHSSNSGAFEMQIGKDGSMSQSLDFEINEHGVNGKVKMKLKMDACPDVNGRVEVNIDVDSQMSVIGKPGTGGYVHSTFKYERYLDDDAHLMDTNDGFASNLHVKMGGYENFESQSVEMTTGYTRGGQTTRDYSNEQGFSIFRMEEAERTLKLLQATEFLQTIMAEMMLRGLGGLSGSPWESGRCIDLQVSSNPGKRNGIQPSTAFEIEAKPRAKSDGAQAGGSVIATLTGGSSLNPAGSKVKADAKFSYTGPAEKEETASIAFEARSKRGVGKATLAFDTKALGAFRMEGGAGDFHGVGTVCNLDKTFFVEGGGNTVRFEPESDQGGRYSYSGNMSGFRVFGHGTYKVKFNGDQPVGIVAEGPGSVETPAGVVSGNGSETYTLTPLGDTACDR